MVSTIYQLYFCVIFYASYCTAKKFTAQQCSFSEIICFWRILCLVLSFWNRITFFAWHLGSLATSFILCLEWKDLPNYNVTVPREKLLDDDFYGKGQNTSNASLKKCKSANKACNNSCQSQPMFGRTYI